MSREQVWFFSGGVRVSGWFTVGAAGGRRPAVVFCPGFTGTKYAAFYQPYVDRLTAAGYSMLLIDYRGWGDSEGERGLILPLEQVEDIRNALSYLETRNDVDPGQLGLFGVSFGGGHASHVAGVDRRVRCAVAVSAVGDGGAWLRQMRREHEWHEFLDRLAEERRHRALTGEQRYVDPTEEIMVSTPERRATTVKGSVPQGKTATRTPLHCAQAIIDYRPVDVVARIAPRAMLWFAVERDAVVPAEHSETMFTAAGEPKRRVRLPGNLHYAAYVEHLEVIARESLAWYNRHLRQDQAHASR